MRRWLLLAFTWRAEGRLAASVDATAVRSLAEYEALSDRMWELQESEERFRGLIDALGDLVVHRDRDGRIVYTNRVFEELVGAGPRELAGRTLAELGIDVGVVPDAAFAEGECLSSTDVAIRTPKGAALVLVDRAVGARQGERRRLAPRHRPRHHRPQARRDGA